MDTETIGSYVKEGRFGVTEIRRNGKPDRVELQIDGKIVLTLSHKPSEAAFHLNNLRNIISMYTKLIGFDDP